MGVQIYIYDIVSIAALVLGRLVGNTGLGRLADIPRLGLCIHDSYCPNYAGKQNHSPQICNTE